jgi:hypothetical protein
MCNVTLCRYLPTCRKGSGTLSKGLSVKVITEMVWTEVSQGWGTNESLLMQSGAGFDEHKILSLLKLCEEEIEVKIGHLSFAQSHNDGASRDYLRSFSSSQGSQCVRLFLIEPRWTSLFIINS